LLFFFNGSKFRVVVTFESAIVPTGSSVINGILDILIERKTGMSRVDMPEPDAEKIRNKRERNLAALRDVL
jgi:hypothetical protein